MITRLNPALEVRGKIIAGLKDDAALTALVPAARIYPQRTPAPNASVAPLQWPFIKWGAPIVTPRYIDGGNGGDVSGALHVYVKRSDAIPDPEAFAMDACAHITRVLNDADDVDLGDGSTLSIYPRQAQIMQDGDADSWHAFVQFDATAS